ncbi:MAG: hypothetical protein LBR73_04335 [Oscillospiraceae bacterium]|jgi:hypothetical protein|nr:hypothetical protein [Oscillospiraceae bacterium]
MKTLRRRCRQLAQENAALREEAERLSFAPPAVSSATGTADTAPQAYAGRFPQLAAIDRAYADRGEPRYTAFADLEALSVHMRCFSASRLGFYTEVHTFSIFLAALACGKTVYLRGGAPESAIAVPYAAALALGEELDCPGADRAELTAALYRAHWDAAPKFILLPPGTKPPADYSGSGIRLAAGAWPDDPRYLQGGCLALPANVRYLSLEPQHKAIGFVAPPAQEAPFPAMFTAARPVRDKQLRQMFTEAAAWHPVPEGSETTYRQIETLLANELMLSAAERGWAQFEKFHGVCASCGMGDAAALDAFLYHHALRCLERTEPAARRWLLPQLLPILHESGCTATASWVDTLIHAGAPKK